MRRFPIAVSLFTTGLVSLILASATPANANPHPVARYRIANIDVSSFATASTATQSVTLQPPSTVTELQHWTFSSTRLGTKVTNTATGGCLGLPDYWIAINLPPVVQQPCKNRETDYWKIISTTAETVIFQNVGHGNCMGLDTTVPTLAVQQYSSTQLYLVPCQDDERNQHFRLVA